jgi:DNA-nicking Smr family endonuclease
MAGRRLSPDEARLWARVIADVQPLAGKHAAEPPVTPEVVAPKKLAVNHVNIPKMGQPKKVPERPHATATLDASWDRTLARGRLDPDRTVDLHGHGLSAAYALLDQALERAISQDERVLLLVTGKAPKPGSEHPHARGAIRASVADWLAASRHARAIAAVRNAHPRHGGAGALYIVLRRPRAPRNS